MAAQGAPSPGANSTPFASPPERPGPGITGQTLTVDSENSDDLGEIDRASISTSMTSAVTEFRFDHGRRYHAFAENAYWLPNDDIEIERLDIQHHVWRLSLQGKFHLAPLDLARVKDVVDIGTGTGLWALDFAEAHPDINVLGTDLSPIQPPYAPPNCSFLVDNAESDWVFDNKFDYIHSRMLIMGIKDWPRYFRQTWDNLHPGGWMEVKEPQFPIAAADDSVQPDSPLMALSQYIRDAAAVAGIDTLIVHDFRRMLKEQGFVNINVEPVKWPVGPWPKGENEKNIGRWMVPDTKEFITPAATKLFTTHLKWSKERVEEFLEGVRKDIDDRKRHYYWSLFVVYAQKPENATEPSSGSLTKVTAKKFSESSANGATGSDTSATASEPKVNSTMDTTVNTPPAAVGNVSQPSQADATKPLEVPAMTPATTTKVGSDAMPSVTEDSVLSEPKVQTTSATTVDPVASVTNTAPAVAPSDDAKTVPTDNTSSQVKPDEKMDTS